MKHNTASVAEHIETLARTFATTPETVRKWIKRFRMSPMPSAAILAFKLAKNPSVCSTASLDVARREIANCKNPLLEGLRESIQK